VQTLAVGRVKGGRRIGHRRPAQAVGRYSRFGSLLAGSDFRGGGVEAKPELARRAKESHFVHWLPCRMKPAADNGPH
jgi:hypothetical protein